MPSFRIDFNEAIYAKIVLLATRAQVMKSEIIARAIDTYFFLNNELGSGKKLILRDTAGNEKEVVFQK